MYDISYLKDEPYQLDWIKFTLKVSKVRRSAFALKFDTSNSVFRVFISIFGRIGKSVWKFNSNLIDPHVNQFEVWCYTVVFQSNFSILNECQIKIDFASHLFDYIFTKMPTLPALCIQENLVLYQLCGLTKPSDGIKRNTTFKNIKLNLILKA